MKKIHSQPGPSTSGPPISHAAVAPMPPSAPQIPSALFRSEPSGKVVEMIERAVGVMIAAPTPWTRAGGDERRRRPGEPAEERRGREEEDTGHEQATAPEQVGRASSEQEQAAEGERVGAQHPLQALLREAEVRLDRGQRHEHDRGVEDHHEEGAAEERERPPAAGIGVFSTRLHFGVRTPRVALAPPRWPFRPLVETPPPAPGRSSMCACRRLPRSPRRHGPSGAVATGETRRVHAISS